jgi:hypothetical protein
MRAPARIYATEELLREMDEAVADPVGGGPQDADKSSGGAAATFPTQKPPGADDPASLHAIYPAKGEKLNPERHRQRVDVKARHPASLSVGRKGSLVGSRNHLGYLS